jgi:hypothetical protein
MADQKTISRSAINPLGWAQGFQSNPLVVYAKSVPYMKLIRVEK